MNRAFCRVVSFSFAMTPYLCSVSVLATPSLADLAYFDQPLPTISRAVDIVVDTSPKEITVGDDVVFTQQSQGAAPRIRREGFQVRVFTLNSLGAAPPQARPAIDDCQIYYSSVYQVAASVNPKIQVVSKADAAWLRPAEGNRGITNGYYLMVFEKAISKDPIFRIKAKDASVYFATGIALVVKDDQRTPVQDVVKQYAGRLDRHRQFDTDLIKNNDTVPCHTFVKFAAEDKTFPMTLTVAKCDNDSNLLW